MKVYESSNPINLPAGQAGRGFKKVPQVKLKNKKLIQSGFEIGIEFNVIYEQGKIILELSKGDNKNESG